MCNLYTMFTWCALIEISDLHCVNNFKGYNRSFLVIEFQCVFLTVDSVGVRGSHDIHLEFTNERDSAEIRRT